MLLYLSMSDGLSHSGRTDSHGCHAGRKPYHCHGGYTSSIKIDRSYIYEAKSQEQGKEIKKLKEKLKEKQASHYKTLEDNSVLTNALAIQGDKINYCLKENTILNEEIVSIRRKAKQDINACYLFCFIGVIAFFLISKLSP